MSIDSKPFSFSFEKIQHSTSFHPIFEKNVFKKEFLETIFNDNKRRCNSEKKDVYVWLSYTIMIIYHHILSYIIIYDYWYALLTWQFSSHHIKDEMKWLLEVIFYTTETFGGKSFYLKSEKYKKPVWEFPCFPVHSEEWSDFEFGRGEWTWNKMEGDIWNNATEYFTATSSNSDSN